MMKMRLSLQVIAITLLLPLIASPVMAVYGQAAGYVDSDSSRDLQRLRLRASILQMILERAIDAANISEPLRSEAEALISMNVSALSEDELKRFIAEAESLLAEIRESLRREYNVTLSQERVAMRLLERIRERLNLTFAKINMTPSEAEQIRERIREWVRERAGENLTVRDVAHLLKGIREVLRHRWVMRFSEGAMNYSEKAAESGVLFGLTNALNASSKVLAVLGRVKERLIEVNASEAAVEAIEHAMEKITSAREILRQLIERVSTDHPLGNATQERAREELGSILRERAEKLNETIEEYLGRLRELRDKAVELNLTGLAEEIEREAANLEALKDRVASGNQSLGDIVSAMASAKGLIKRAENLIEKATKKISETMPPIAPPRGGPQPGGKRPSTTPPGQLGNQPGKR